MRTETDETMHSRRVYRWILIAAALWLGGIVCPTIIAQMDMPSLATFIRDLYRPACHQMISRSLVWLGSPLAVCARCTGIYIGAFVGLIALGLMRRSAVRETPPRWVLFAAIAPAVIDFLAGFLGLAATPNLFHFATGAIAGFAGAFFVYPGLLSLALALPGRIPRRLASASPSAAMPPTPNVS